MINSGDDHSQRLAQSIRSACKEYMQNAASLDDLHRVVAGNMSAFEIIGKEREVLLEKAFVKFDGDLELIRFMHSSDEEYSLACDAINNLLNVLNQVLTESPCSD